MCDKYYIGYYKGKELIAIMDFIMAYPDEKTAFIGLDEGGVVVEDVHEKLLIGSFDKLEFIKPAELQRPYSDPCHSLCDRTEYYGRYESLAAK